MARTRELRPIEAKDEYAEKAFKAADYVLYTTVFLPLLEAVAGKAARREAAKATSLHQALLSGRLRYQDGLITGTFSATLSREIRQAGGTWDPKRKGFKIKEADLSPELRHSVAAGKHAVDQQAQAVQRAIDQVMGKIKDMPAIDFANYAQETIDKLHEQIKKTLPKDIEMPLEMSSTAAEAIKRDYSENMNLSIKGWADEAVKELRTRVEANVSEGFRADKLQSMLQAQYGVTKRHARFLALQETSLLVSKFRQERYKDAGIGKYKWSTSGDGRVRKDHRDLNGKVFSWDNPPITDTKRGSRNHPGEDFNCLPEDSNVDFAYGIEKLFRRRYAGKLTTIVTESGKTLRATPNHQVLTLGGWKAIGSLNDSDYIFDLSDELIKPLKVNMNNREVTIAEVFNSLSEYLPMLTAYSSSMQFHGDGTNGDVDIVRPTWPLGINRKGRGFKFIYQFAFAYAYPFTSCLSDLIMDVSEILFRFFGVIANIFGRLSCRTRNLFQLFFRSPMEAKEVCLASVANMDSGIKQPFVDDNPLNPSPLGNRKLAFPGNISVNNRLGVKFQKVGRSTPTFAIGFNPKRSKFFRDIVGTKADDLGGFNKRLPLVKKASRVLQVMSEDFVGHVYNLQTVNNWYCCNGIVIHNCRCVAIPIITE